MDAAIRNTESELNTRLAKIRRSYNNMLLGGDRIRSSVESRRKKRKRLKIKMHRDTPKLVEKHRGDITRLTQEWESSPRLRRKSSFDTFVRKRLGEKKLKKREKKREKKEALRLWKVWKNGINDRDIDDYLMAVEKSHLNKVPQIAYYIKLSKEKILKNPESVHHVLGLYDRAVDEWVKRKIRELKISEKL